MISTRKAFGDALVRLGGENPMMVVLDGDVQNSTYTELFAQKYPDQFIECFIAEQNMVGVALGMERMGCVPWVATFSAFMTRAHDQIRMAALSGANIKFCGSHGGVAIGADGPSQMGLEDFALFRAVHGSTVLSPSDAYQTEKLVELMVKTKGIVYMRTMREATPIIYGPHDEFTIGGSKTFGDGAITVIATGVTVHEALKAQKILEKQGTGIRVIDCYSIKPIDEKTLQKAAKDSKAMIVVEDHYPEGGLGEAVSAVIGPVIHLAVRKTPRSGTPEELLHFEGIDANAIVKAVHDLSK